MNRSSHSELNFRQDVRPSNIKEVQEEKKEEWFKTLLEKNRISFPHFKYSISNKSSQVVVYLVLKTIEIKTEADQLCFSLKKKGISLESTSTKRLPNQLVEASFYYRIVFIVTYKSKVNQATPKYVAITIKSLEPNEFQISKDFNINMHTLIEKYRNVYPDMRCDEKGVPGNWLSHSVELIGTGRLHVEFAFQSADAVNLSTLENLSGCLRHESTPSEGKSISPTDASPLAPTDVPNDSPPITSSQNGDDVARSNTDNRAASGRAPVEYPMSPSFSILSRQEWVPDNQRRKCHHCPKLFVNSIFLIYLQMGFRNDRR